MTKSERETQERAEAFKELRGLLPAGSTVYTILRDVSRSGMSRKISVISIKQDDRGEIYTLNLTHLVAKVLGWRVKTGFNDALIVSGCGTDMGFHVVYSLAQALGYTRKDAEGSNAYGLNQRCL